MKKLVLISMVVCLLASTACQKEEDKSDETAIAALALLALAEANKKSSPSTFTMSVTNNFTSSLYFYFI
jgi:hypothetical protein